jgi:RHS repeat-associated protein
MKTWQNFAGPSGAATTTWYYNAQRGWLDYKRYNDNTGPDYTYKPSGRLETRLWWRGNPTILTTYTYNKAGDLQTVTYNDGTPSVTYTYDRRGRQKTANCNSMTTTFTYNDAGQLLTESYSGGSLNGLFVTSHYDNYLRRDQLQAKNGETVLTTATYGYEAASSRLQTVSDGTYSATYSYLANSPLVEQITFKQSTTTRMTTIKQYDNLNRLRTISSVPSGSSAVTFQYQYNDANQRRRNTEASGDYWSYQYDTLGQVSSGKKYTSGGTPISGRQFEYDFDDIANRDYTFADGTTTDYTANLLNQYTTRVTGGTTETFQHDEDGNLQSHSLWVYTWDAENRLVKLESQASVPDASKRKLQFEYDYQGRRIAKKVYVWSGGGYSPTPSVSLKFVYDGWNLIAELAANNNLVSSYMWGLDLTGSEQGAGGVGGLLLFTDHSSPVTRHFALYDGNGNVMALVNAADGTISVQYEYSPFGETLSASGSAASSNPFRFSTKYLHSESGFLYYGYRYYNPSTGRSPSIDFIFESCGINLYAFVANSPINAIDSHGLIFKAVKNKVPISFIQNLTKNLKSMGGLKIFGPLFVRERMTLLRLKSTESIAQRLEMLWK